jgi:NADH:ubiquinone oxidoreductase subunit 6 (subunit J)
MFIINLLLVFIVITSLILAIYSLSQFIYICFVTLTSVCLGLLLLANGLSFAGSVLIIVNAGAVAMVFLFVCILSARNTIVSRRITPAKYLMLVLIALFFATCFFFNYQKMIEMWFLDEHNVLDLGVSKNSILLRTSLPEDFSLASHIILLEKNNSFLGFLPLLGFFLVTVMVIAILVTQRTKSNVVDSVQDRRWVWDESIARAPGRNPSIPSLKKPAYFYAHWSWTSK